MKGNKGQGSYNPTHSGKIQHVKVGPKDPHAAYKAPEKPHPVGMFQPKRPAIEQVGQPQEHITGPR